MSLNIKQVFENVVQTLDASCEVSAAELDFVRGYVFSAPLKIVGSVSNRAGIVRLNIHVSALISAECDRCLTSFERLYEYDFEHIVVRSLAGEDNDEYIIADNDRINVGEIALTDILLELPTKQLCADDCAGICAQCGKCLNDGQCGCAAEGE